MPTIPFLKKNKEPYTVLKTAERSENGAKPKKKGALRENIEAILVAIILALFIRTFIVQAFKIPSGSMKETLQIGDHILVNKFIYGVKMPFVDKTIIPIKEPKRGDIIVFKNPDKSNNTPLIKRVIGLPGEEVEVKSGLVYINGSPLNESYIIELPSYNMPNSIIPSAEYFVLGDNRNASRDSHMGWTVSQDDILGKAWLSVWPLDRLGLIQEYTYVNE